MALTTGYFENWYVVTAESRYGMDLLALAQPLAEAKLATFVVAP